MIKEALKEPHEHILGLTVPKDDFMMVMDELHADPTASQLSISYDPTDSEYRVSVHVWH